MSERKEDQILRTVVLVGVWPGGPCATKSHRVSGTVVAPTRFCAGSRYKAAKSKCVICGEDALMKCTLSPKDWGLQQEYDFAIPGRPHSLAIFRQQARSVAVIEEAGSAHVKIGSAPNMTARANTANLIHSFNVTSVPTTDNWTQQPAKGFRLHRLRGSALATGESSKSRMGLPRVRRRGWAGGI